jgi:hypothetical protein
MPTTSFHSDESSVESPAARPGQRRPVTGVVITGVGVVSPLGNTPNELIAALREGRSAIRPLIQVPTEAVGFVTGSQGNFLRQVEEEWGTLMFFADFRGRGSGREVSAFG